MKRISILMVALLVMGGMVMAQGQRRGGSADPKVRAERMTERMVKEYSLSDKQKKELLEVNTTLVGKDTDCQSELKKEMKASREAYDAQLKKILTKDQYDSYIKKQAERKLKMKADHQGRRQKSAPKK